MDQNGAAQLASSANRLQAHPPSSLIDPCTRAVLLHGHCLVTATCNGGAPGGSERATASRDGRAALGAWTIRVRHIALVLLGGDAGVSQYFYCLQRAVCFG